MQYFYSPSAKGFYIDEVNGINMPTDIIEITEDQHNDFFKKQSSGRYTWEFDTGANRFIYIEMLIDHEENAKQQCILEAKQLLIDSDWRVLPDKFSTYDSITQRAIVEYREQLREVVRGNSNEMPAIPNFMLS